jgi:hypothetical protein
MNQTHLMLGLIIGRHPPLHLPVPCHSVDALMNVTPGSSLPQTVSHSYYCASWLYDGLHLCYICSYLSHYYHQLASVRMTWKLSAHTHILVLRYGSMVTSIQI